MTYPPTMDFFLRTLDENGNVKELNEEVLDYIRKRYSSPEIPACRVCGGKLEVARMEAGKTAYAHPRPDGVSFDEWKTHYDQSYWMHVPTADDYVIALLDAYESLQEKTV